MANITSEMVRELRERTGLGIMDCKKALIETEGNMDAAIKILREKGIIKGAKKSGRETNEGVVKLFKNNNGKKVLMLQINCETDFVVKNENFQKLVNDLGNSITNDDKITNMDALPDNINTKITEAVAQIGENIKLKNIRKMQITNDNEYIDNYIHSNAKVGVLLKVKVEKSTTKENEEFKALVKDLCMQIAAMNVKALTKNEVDKEILESEKAIYTKQIQDSGKPENIIEKIVDGKMRKFLSEIVLMEQQFVKDESLTIEKYVNKVSNNLSDKIQPIEFEKFTIGK